VTAIVHTHDIYGRAFTQAGVAGTPPVWRCGAVVATEEIAIFPQADLLFDPEPRQRAVQALGQKAILHEVAHGTDFVGPTLEAVTVRAIHREELLRMCFLSQQLGEPRPLAAGVLEDLAAIGPSDNAWWRYYLIAASQRIEPMQLAML
jgi:ribulose-5-phosphate 4-epimerase/fuculose-1-phosphate aldolase